MARRTTASGSTLPTAKAERTRQRIVTAALDLFRAEGYEATTMRMVADRAGVSVGNAYYYYKSKTLLLEAFYTEIHQDHVALAEPILLEEKDLSKRLLGLMQAKLQVIEPYHRFAGLMFKAAADPKSPLSPFHEASAATRVEGIELFAAALAGSRIRIPKDISLELPGLLWTYSMGIVLYWIHDDSPQRANTRRLMEHSVGIVVHCIKLASNPLMRPLRKKIVTMLRELGEPI